MRKNAGCYCWLCDKTRPKTGICCNGKRIPFKVSEYQTRIDADRVKAAWHTPLTTLAEQRSLETTPLFATGREEQKGLFE